MESCSSGTISVGECTAKKDESVIGGLFIIGEGAGTGGCNDGA